MANISKATFIDQGIEFPLWATEETLQAVRSAIAGDAGQDRRDSRTQVQATRGTTKAVEKTGKASLDYNLRLIRTFGKMDGSFKSLSDAILASGVKGGTGQIIATSLGALDKYVQIVRQLSDVGSGLNSEYIDLVNSSANAFMFIDEFASTVGEHNLAIRNLGESATEGFMQFSQLSRQLQENTRQFGMYGMQQEELNELLLNQIEIERQSGATGLDVTQRTAAAMENLISETSGMAEITGRSRREAMLEAQSATQRVDVSTYLRQVRNRDGDEAADIERGMIQRLVAQMQQQFGKETGAVMANDFIKAYVTGGGLAVAEELQKLAGVTDPTKIQAVIKALGSGDKEQLGGAINSLGLEMVKAADSVDVVMLGLHEGLNMAATAASDFKEMTTKELDVARKNQKAHLESTDKDVLLSLENFQRQIIAQISGSANSLLVIAGNFGVESMKQMNQWAGGIPQDLIKFLGMDMTQYVQSSLAHFGGATPFATLPDAYNTWAGNGSPHDNTAPTVTAPQINAQEPDIFASIGKSISGALSPASALISKEINDLKIAINSLKELLKENL